MDNRVTKWMIGLAGGLWLFLLLPLMASEFPNQDNLLKVVKNDPFLSAGELGVLEIGGIRYLVSVGVSTIDGSSPTAKLNARKTAELKANARMVKFIHGSRINLDETLITKRVVVVESSNGKITGRDERVSSELIESIAEQSEGLLKKIVNLGRWKSLNATLYHVALAVKMTN